MHSLVSEDSFGVACNSVRKMSSQRCAKILLQGANICRNATVNEVSLPIPLYTVIFCEPGICGLDHVCRREEDDQSIDL